MKTGLQDFIITLREFGAKEHALEEWWKYLDENKLGIFKTLVYCVILVIGILMFVDAMLFSRDISTLRESVSKLVFCLALSIYTFEFSFSVLMIVESTQRIWGRLGNKIKTVLLLLLFPGALVFCLIFGIPLSFSPPTEAVRSFIIVFAAILTILLLTTLIFSSVYIWFKRNGKHPNMPPFLKAFKLFWKGIWKSVDNVANYVDKVNEQTINSIIGEPQNKDSNQSGTKHD